MLPIDFETTGDFSFLFFFFGRGGLRYRLRQALRTTQIPYAMIFKEDLPYSRNTNSGIPPSPFFYTVGRESSLRLAIFRFTRFTGFVAVARSRGRVIAIFSLFDIHYTFFNHTHIETRADYTDSHEPWRIRYKRL